LCAAAKLFCCFHRQNSGETAATFPKEKKGKIVLHIKGDRKNIDCNSQNRYFLMKKVLK
jgi:hypothetical protein